MSFTIATGDSSKNLNSDLVFLYNLASLTLQYHFSALHSNPLLDIKVSSLKY